MRSFTALLFLVLIVGCTSKTKNQASMSGDATTTIKPNDDKIAQDYMKKGMIYITQLVYVVPGQEEVFNEFEDIAIPIIRKYNGRLLFRVRPGESAFIEHHIDKPYEIHLVEFDSEQDFENFKQDEERKKFLHLKEQSIKASILYKGNKL